MSRPTAYSSHNSHGLEEPSSPGKSRDLDVDLLSERPTVRILWSALRVSLQAVTTSPEWKPLLGHVDSDRRAGRPQPQDQVPRIYTPLTL